jgi:hypothetical protein
MLLVWRAAELYIAASSLIFSERPATWTLFSDEDDCMRYFADPSCGPCVETKDILDQFGISYWPNFYIINVMGVAEYQGKTPLLELDDGTMLQGKEAILQWAAVISNR